MRRHLPLLAALLTALLVGCSSKPVINPSPLQNFRAELNLARQWSVSEPDRITTRLSVSESNRKIAYATARNEVVMLDANNGKVLWRVKVDGEVAAPIGFASEESSVLVLLQGRGAVSLDADTGQQKWFAILPAEMRVAPVAAAGKFIVLTADGRIVPLDETSGRRDWKVIERPAPALTVRGAGALLVHDGLVYAGLHNAKLLAIKPSNGEVQWETSVAALRGSTEVERIADVLSPMYADKGLICVTAYRHALSCVGSKSGNGIVSQAIETVQPGVFVPVVDMIAAFDDKSILKAWRISDRTQVVPRWENELFIGRGEDNGLSMAVQGDAIFVADKLGFVQIVNARSGNLLGRTKFNDGPSQLWAGEINRTAMLIGHDQKTIQAWQIQAVQ